MQIIFGNYSFITIYLDDITIHSKSFDLYVNHVRTTIGILRDHKLKLKKQKCKWFSKEIRLLGHIISGGSVKLDPLKVKAILDRKPLTNRKFILNFSVIALPISNLLKKDVVINWSDECV